MVHGRDDNSMKQLRKESRKRRQLYMAMNPPRPAATDFSALQGHTRLLMRLGVAV